MNQTTSRKIIDNKSKNLNATQVQIDYWNATEIMRGFGNRNP